MEKVFAKGEELFVHIKEYATNRMDAVKLNTAEKTSKLAANIIAICAVGAVMLLFTLFASIALAYALGEWMGKPYWGFLTVAALFLLLGVITWLFRARLLQLPIMNSLLHQLYTEEDTDEED